MRRLTTLLFSGIIASILLSCSDMKTSVDLLIHADAYFDGTAQGRQQSIIITDGQIVEMTSYEMAEKQYTAAHVIDARDHFVMPGIIEGHGHLLLMGRLARQTDLSAYDSWLDIEQAIVDAAKHTPKGAWIIGHSWHQAHWSSTPHPHVQGYPVMSSLSERLPDHPIYLQHASLHAGIVNQAALDALGISDDITDPDGGTYLRDQQGRLTGMLLENALKPLRDTINAMDGTEVIRQEAFEAARSICHRHGITAFHDAAMSLDELAFFKKLDRQNRLSMHIYGMAYDDINKLYAHVDSWPVRSRHLHVAAIKNFYDGALGARSALLRAPYADASHLMGLRLLQRSEVDSTLRLCAAHDLQYCVHAIGDLACKEVIDNISSVMDSKKNHRSRIEHAQHITDSDLDRMADLDIIASIQPIHCSSDSRFLYERLGEARAHATSFKWRSMLDRELHIAMGTDVPVEPIQPFHNIYVACTRRSLGFGQVYQPEQAMTRIEALQAYTSGNAYAAHQEHIRGQLKVGMAADITIVDRNLVTCQEEELLDAQAVFTIYNGKIVYEKDK